MTLKGNRTRIVAALSMIIPVLQSTGFVALIPAEYQLVYAIFLAGLMIYMRQITDTAPGQAK